MSRTIHQATELLALLGRGNFAPKLDEHLHAALTALDESPSDKATATVTITLHIARKDDMVDITPSVKSKLPEEKGFGGTIFWVTEDGALSVQHPNQMSMFAGPRDAAPASERDRGSA